MLREERVSPENRARANRQKREAAVTVSTVNVFRMRAHEEIHKAYF